MCASYLVCCHFNSREKSMSSVPWDINPVFVRSFWMPLKPYLGVMVPTEVDFDVFSRRLFRHLITDRIHSQFEPGIAGGSGRKKEGDDVIGRVSVQVRKIIAAGVICARNRHRITL